MLDAFLNPSAIAFITSLGAPAGLFAAEATGTFAQSLVISGATNALTGFFKSGLPLKNFGISIQMRSRRH